jgi:hypothetical protein
MLFKSYIDPTERKEADKQLPRLMLEGLLLGGSGLGVLALIFEIAADAFSVAIHDMLEESMFVRFNVDTGRIVTLITHLYNVDLKYFNVHYGHQHHERYEEPSVELEVTYQQAYNMRDKLFSHIEHYSHYGIFTFIDKYHANWINVESGRDAPTVQQAMLHILFPMTPQETVWDEFRNFNWEKMPEAVWQFSRERYRWAKDQWPNLSDRITTVWILQDYGLIPKEVNVEVLISVSAENRIRRVEIHTHGPEKNIGEGRG